MACKNFLLNLWSSVRKKKLEAGCWAFAHDWEQVYPDAYLCHHCKRDDLTYDDLVRSGHIISIKEFLGYWCFRKWVPEKCLDCGKRFGNHYNCIPF